MKKWKGRRLLPLLMCAALAAAGAGAEETVIPELPEKPESLREYELVMEISGPERVRWSKEYWSISSRTPSSAV